MLNLPKFMQLCNIVKQIAIPIITLPYLWCQQEKRVCPVLSDEAILANAHLNCFSHLLKVMTFTLCVFPTTQLVPGVRSAVAKAS